MPDDSCENPTVSHCLPSGLSIPGYDILGELGRGGMGIVYRARDQRLGREVAVKVLSELSCANPQGRERFLREARLASRLQHPHICTVHSLGEANEVPFLVLELISGRSLRQFTGENPSLAERLRVAGQIAQGLAAAHAEGVIHRDLKPANVMVGEDGRVRILDFGLARAIESDLPHDEPLTQQGVAVGTLRYMAPEQARGERVGPEADIFSLGIVLFEFFNDFFPFPGKSDLAVVTAIQHQDPLPPAPHLPAELTDLLTQMLTRDPRHRPSAQEVADTLERLSRGDSPTGTIRAPAISQVVGRTRERELLRNAFSETCRGRGRFIGIAGEPGIGKTTLVEEFLNTSLSEQKHCLVTRGRCSERLANAEGYLPLLEVLEGLLGGPHAAKMNQRIQDLAPTWQTMLHPGGLRLSDSSQLRPVNLARELIRLFSVLCEQGVVILFIDDLQWADFSSVDVLGHLIPRCAELHLMIVATYRSADLARERHSFLALKREWYGRGLFREISLGFLQPDEVAKLLAVRFPGNRFPPGFAELLHTRTEGSPLFITDLIRFLQDQGTIAPVDAGWELTRSVEEFAGELPGSIREMIHRKLESLPEEDRRLLEVGAVQGVQFDSAILAQTLSVDPDTVERQLARLESDYALIRQECEHEFPSGELSIRYSFVHILYQNTLQSELTLTRRTRLSKSVADTLLAFCGEAPHALAGELAILFETARDWSQAVSFFLQAALGAAKVCAFQEMLALTNRGMALLSRLPEPMRDRMEIEFQQLLGMYHAGRQGFASQPMRQACERALALCRKSGYDAPMSSLLAGLFLNHLTRGETATALSLGEEALQRAEALGNRSLLLEAYYMIGTAHFYRGHFRVGLEILQQGITFDDCPGQAGTPVLSPMNPSIGCRCFAALGLWNLGYWEQSATRIAEIVSLMESNQQLSVPARVYGLMSVVLYHRAGGHAANCEKHVAGLIDLATEYGMVQWSAFGQVLRGWSWTQRGKLTEGQEEMVRGIQAYRSTGSVSSLPWLLSDLAEVYGKVGQIEKGLALLDEVGELIKRGLHHRESDSMRVRAQLLSLQGRRDEAQTLFRQSIALAKKQESRWYLLLAALEWAHAFRGQPEEEEAIQELREITNWFSEGADIPLLINAREFLAGL